MTNIKLQKKVHLTTKAAWYLDRLKSNDGVTNGEAIEKLIEQAAFKNGLPADPTPEQLATRPEKPKPAPTEPRAEKSDEDRLFLLRFGGVYLGGEMLIVTNTRRKAFNRARKKLDEMLLLKDNLKLTMDDLEELPFKSGLVVVIDDGNY